MMGLSKVLIVILSCISLDLATMTEIMKLSQIEDLASMSYAMAFPHNGLMLLYWFASKVEFTKENLIEFPFDPRLDESATLYLNENKVLPRIHQSVKDEYYYIIGDLRNVAAQFPSYVYQDYYNAECTPEEVGLNMRNEEYRNQDRIVLRLKILPEAIHVIEVYISQTSFMDEMLDPSLTFEVTGQFIKEIQSIMHRKEDMLCPCLKPRSGQAQRMFADQKNIAWFLTLAEYDMYQREMCLSGLHCTHDIGKGCKNHSHCSLSTMGFGVCDWKPPNITVTTDKVNAVITWTNIPETRVVEEGLVLALFSDDKSSKVLAETKVNGLTSGSFLTDTTFTAGLQARLLLKGEGTTYILWRGPEVWDTNRPMKIPGYDASIQLFIRNGLAHGRLYVKKTFPQWKSTFNGWWLGYYASPEASSYLTYKYLRNMVKTTDPNFTEFDVFEQSFNKPMYPRAVLKLTAVGVVSPWTEE